MLTRVRRAISLPPTSSAEVGISIRRLKRYRFVGLFMNMSPDAGAESGIMQILNGDGAVVMSFQMGDFPAAGTFAIMWLAGLGYTSYPAAGFTFIMGVPPDLFINPDFTLFFGCSNGGPGIVVTDCVLSIEEEDNVPG